MQQSWGESSDDVWISVQRTGHPVRCGSRQLSNLSDTNQKVIISANSNILSLTQHSMKMTKMNTCWTKLDHLKGLILIINSFTLAFKSELQKNMDYILPPHIKSAATVSCEILMFTVQLFILPSIRLKFQWKNDKIVAVW